MKKVLLVLVLLLTLFLTGCKGFFEPVVVPNENSITLKLEEDFASVIEGEIPTFTFHFDGTLNTNKNINKSFYTVFSNNDDIILSNALNKLFEQYKDRMYVELVGSQSVNSTLFSTLNEYGAVENVKYTPDDYKVYDETAYISLENGLKLTIDYRRFIYNGENYYTWRYTNSITMYLYYPMLAINDGLTNKLMMISLPNRVTYSVGPTLKLENILNGTTYADGPECLYYTFKYVFDLDKDGNEPPLEQKQQYIIDYYVNEMNGTYDETTKIITYSYLGNDFTVELLENNFKMHYKGKTNNSNI